MEKVVRYTYRLRPGAQAERALLDEWHRCRFLWNEAVHQGKSGRKPTRGKLGKLLTAARKDNRWLRDGWQNAQAETLNTYALAREHSFKVRGRGKPKVKRKDKALPSLPFTRNGFSIVDGRLRLPKGTGIPVVWSRGLPAEPTSVRVYRDSLGHWYASFVVRRDAEPAPPANGRIGIDWGIATPATTTDPAYDLPYAGHRKRCAAELARAQRKMARRRRPKGQAPSRGYQQARLSKARIEKRAARQAQHAARVWAKRVVDHHQLIAVEDLRLKFLARSTMARKAADIALGATRRELIDRAVRAGRTVVNVKPAYTTMTCSSCFARAKQRLGLAERIFQCRDCGYRNCRDENAARTILAVAERGHVSVDDVRHDAACLPLVAVSAQSELQIPRLSAVGSR
jgi:putative transposase